MFSTEELVCSCQQEPYPSSNYLVLCILQMEYRIQVAVCVVQAVSFTYWKSSISQNNKLVEIGGIF